MPYVDRDLNGNINAIYSNAQREGHEFVELAELWTPAPTIKQQTDAICAAKGVNRETVWAVILATEGAARATALATGYPEAAVLAEAYTRMKLYRECKETEAACRAVETA
jgi:hypothetical protein